MMNAWNIIDIEVFMAKLRAYQTLVTDKDVRLLLLDSRVLLFLPQNQSGVGLRGRRGRGHLTARSRLFPKHSPA